MSNITLEKVLQNLDNVELQRCEKFINSERLNNDLLSLPFMNMGFQCELQYQDIFTFNQLIGVFASYNFQFPVCKKHFARMDERLLLCVLYRLGMMGFTLPEIKNDCEYLPFYETHKENEEINEEKETNDEENEANDEEMLAYYQQE